MQLISQLSTIIAVAFMVCYLYQYVYLFLPFLVRRRTAPVDIKQHRFAVLISARNEQTVIANLIDSITAQNYPRDLVTIFVVADNCTDNTAAVARKAGAVVFERFNTDAVGKGYALDYLLGKIRTLYSSSAFDAFLVLDADNLLDEYYLTAMNKSFCEGHKIITSYRNSKNYGSNWISAGYALWFLRESKYLNYSRMLAGTSCAVSGTGFLFSREILERNDGWKFFLLTEDIEFSVHSVLQGEKIAICMDAVLYDEQPVTFRQSWTQRLRWAKGFFQVFAKYGKSLAVNTVKKPSFACYDMTMMIMPAIILTFMGLVLNVITAVMTLISGGGVLAAILPTLQSLFGPYMILFAMGALTTITEWRQIHCVTWKKILYCFTFPLFMLTYIPIAIKAAFSDVEWTPIEHTHGQTLSQVRGLSDKAG